MDKQPWLADGFLDALADHASSLNSLNQLVYVMGLAGHPYVQSQFVERGKLAMTDIRKAVYHVDIDTTHKQHPEAQRKLKKANLKKSAAANENRKAITAAAGRSITSAGWETVLHQLAQGHLQSRFAKSRKKPYLSIRAQYGLQVESLASKFGVPGKSAVPIGDVPDTAAASVDDTLCLADADVSDPFGCVSMEGAEQDIVAPLLLNTAMEDPLLSDMGSLFFFQIVSARPAKKQRIVAVGSSGTDQLDISVRACRCFDLDYSEDMAVVSTESATPGPAMSMPVVFWRLPSIGNLHAMVTCIDEWEEAGVSQYSFLDRSLEILQSKRLLVDFDKDRVFYNHVLCLLMRDGA